MTQDVDASRQPEGFREDRGTAPTVIVWRLDVTAGLVLQNLE
jgi:hypothetical protein